MLTYRDNIRNLVIFTIDNLGTPSGYSIISPQIIMPILLGYLGASNTVVGLIPAIAGIGAYLPSLLTASYVERKKKIRNHLAILAIFERTPFLLVGLCLLHSNSSNRSMLTMIMLTCWTVTNVIIGSNMPTYYSAIARYTYPKGRGFVFGLGGALGGLLGIVGANIAAYYLRTYDFPVSFVYCYYVGFAWLVISAVPFFFIKEERVDGEPNTSTHESPKSNDDSTTSNPTFGKSKGQIRNGVLRHMKQDVNLRRLILSESMLILGLAATNFLSVAARESLSFNLAMLGSFNITSMVATFIAGVIMGIIADKIHHVHVLELSGVFTAMSSLLALIAKNNEVIWHMSFVCFAVANIGIRVSGMNIVLELSGPSKAAEYSSLMMSMPTPIRMGAPLLMGLIADKMNFAIIFIISIISSIAALIMFIKLRKSLKLSKMVSIGSVRVC